jgi:hypothetical protein
MPERPLQVTGLAEVIKSWRAFPDQAAAVLVETLKEGADEVRDDAANRLLPFSQKSAEGYRVKVRARGIDVEQTLGRTTGRRPDFGRFQMARTLGPALTDHETEIKTKTQAALDELAEKTNL